MRAARKLVLLVVFGLDTPEHLVLVLDHLILVNGRDVLLLISRGRDRVLPVMPPAIFSVAFMGLFGHFGVGEAFIECFLVPHRSIGVCKLVHVALVGPRFEALRPVHFVCPWQAD